MASGNVGHSIGSRNEGQTFEPLGQVDRTSGKKEDAQDTYEMDQSDAQSVQGCQGCLAAGSSAILVRISFVHI